MEKNRPHHLNPKRETARVVFCYKNFAAHTGVSHIGLGVSATCTAKVLIRCGVWAEVWPVVSPSDIADRLRAEHQTSLQRGEVDVSHVVICAPWVPTASLAALAREFHGITFSVISHSNVGFLFADAHGIKLLRETADLQAGTHNVRLTGNCRRFCEWATRTWGVNVACLPNLYDLSEALPTHRAPWTGGKVKLGLFGAARPLKNGITAAAAACELAARLRVPVELYVSSGREEGGGHGALEQMTINIPNLRVIQTGWLGWAEFRKLAATMNVLLQPSFTESFNMVAADGVASGVPCVVSDAIDWAPSSWRADADDALDVARVAGHLLRDQDAILDGRRALEGYVTAGLEAWREYLLGDRRLPFERSAS